MGQLERAGMVSNEDAVGKESKKNICVKIAFI